MRIRLRLIKVNLRKSMKTPIRKQLKLKLPHRASEWRRNKSKNVLRQKKLFSKQKLIDWKARSWQQLRKFKM